MLADSEGRSRDLDGFDQNLIIKDTLASKSLQQMMMTNDSCRDTQVSQLQQNQQSALFCKDKDKMSQNLVSKNGGTLVDDNMSFNEYTNTNNCDMIQDIFSMQS